MTTSLPAQPPSSLDDTAPLVDAATLKARVDAGEPVQFVDATFDLADPGAGERRHRERRLPGSTYLHLERDLSAPKAATGGRHPLPTREAFAARLAALGLDDARPIVVVDRQGGMIAARAWWMLRWIGHGASRLLDGGVDAWVAAGGPVESGDAPPRPPRAAFAVRGDALPTVAFETLLDGLGMPPRLIVDARAADRFRGENETLDPLAGHIPGALNRPFRDNLDAEGRRFKPAAQLRDEWLALLAGRDPRDAVLSCGSGVTACHHALAMAVAGLPGATLYPGSWSDWSSRPGAPVALGG